MLRPVYRPIRSESDRAALAFGMTLSLVLGFLMLLIKVLAYRLTGSAAILSDAAESVVHVAAVSFAAYSLRLSHKPPDDSHLYGHSRIAFFSAGFEGAMIMLAAGYILYESIHKWLTGLQLEHLGLGTLLIAAAAALNGALGAYLVWLGRRKRSLILLANGKHVLTDCWTSAGVLLALGLVRWTGWLAWDPICGILVALNILVSGTRLVHSALAGLMDQTDPVLHRQLTELLDKHTADHGISYHELRHRNMGDALWVEVHLLFPDDTSLREAHRIATAVEQAVEMAFEPAAHVTSHLECAIDHDRMHPPAPGG
jgi:cation diffusion facilitator family transporter